MTSTRGVKNIIITCKCNNYSPLIKNGDCRYCYSFIIKKR